ncbi:ninjurin-1-like isoform X2 [Centruroides vittatus]|uniref:ninjurin-1-like isoform X2 n=1 Tax=Centruroides vittatus TaxID=120091 RepID=UPI0035108A6A
MAAVGPSPPAGAVKPRALDANVYATKKSVAQGLLDVALLTANASQLKYLLRVGDRHEFFYPMMVLVCLSIVLQICVGVVILVKSRFSINDVDRQPSAERLNDALVWLIFATTVVNAFLSVFGIEPVAEAATNTTAAP